MARKQKTSTSLKYDAFVFGCGAIGLPRPETEFRFDSKRKWRFDFAFPEHKVALEVEGGVWIRGRHTRGSGFILDMAKYNAAAALGWRVLRCTPQDIKSGKALTMVEQVLQSKGVS